MAVLDSVLTVALLTAVGAGAYGYLAHEKYLTTQAALDHHTEMLAVCAHDKDAMRADADKRAADSASSMKATQAELDDLRAQRAEADKRLAAFQALTDKFRKMIDSGKLQVILRHGRMVVKLPAGILFATGSADVSKDGKAALADVATILKQMPERRFMIAGHTDNVPVTPSSPFKNNLQLSTARAETVTEQLIAAGMNPGHLSAAGYSEYEPVRENTSDSGRQENRRIEIVLSPEISDLPAAPGDAAPATSASAGPPTVR
jgi:chemotaxis protein MotB